MTASATPLEPHGRGAGTVPAARPRATSGRDDWPCTTRLLPWTVVGFLALVYLVPFDAIKLPIPLPVDPNPDRLALAAIVVFLLLSMTRGGRAYARLRRSRLDLPILLFFGVALASVLVHAGMLANLGEFSLAVKRLALLLGAFAFFYVVAAIVRPTEVRAFGNLVVVLACITAIGVIYEYRTGTNLFHQWATQLAPAGVSVAPKTPNPPFGRPMITGPTTHGLAVVVMLSVALPFAFLGLWRSPRMSRKLLYGLAIGLILAGALSTLRKSAAVVPGAALLVLLLYRPRPMLRLLPLGAALVAFVQVVAPGAGTGVEEQLLPSSLTHDTSTQARTQDYTATNADVRRHLAFGRGYGSYDPARYRYLDNEYLKRIIETGIIGLACFVLLVLAAFAVAHSTIRSRDPARAPPALAAAAGIAAFGVACSLFDILSFPQATYAFFFAAAIAVVCSSPEPATTTLPDADAHGWGSSAPRDALPVAAPACVGDGAVAHAAAHAAAHADDV